MGSHEKMKTDSGFLLFVYNAFVIFNFVGRTCIYRKKTRRGSSAFMEKEIPFIGILSNKAEQNPDVCHTTCVCSNRLNSPTTFEMPLEVLGHELQFTQDPNSKHLGTKVWDSSLVFAKFLERNCRKGRFSPAKLKGKRVIELGAGYGVSGFGNVTNDF
ncbi:uncharacterized protein LOC130980627 [Arachis stenosperma]|uniref:uncharacterized protein LOC130980627 n=2 Tax=Arachis stenosperma TaxID=217475 RepID=UPI0025AD6D09|nr:uncharacterized protein LOC130980627 [Arachis stenosperma]